ncbi:MAG: serine/threonine-protein phosphatase [Phycisphaeraceae bacterium]|nr:serine/threonine-protein phosphatase [Phycisphaeraceae bacterium]
MTSAFHQTSDFRHELETEHERWLRSRFLWYAGIVAAVLAVRLIAAVGLRAMVGSAEHVFSLADALLGVPAIVMYAAAFWVAFRGTPRKREILRMAYWLIVASGVITIVGSMLGFRGEGRAEQALTGAAGALGIFYAHVFACLFLPWTWRDSARPLVPLLLLNAAVTIFSAWHAPWVALGIIVASPAIGVPGAAVCWWRYSRFRDRVANAALRGRYVEMRRELVDARRIHESLFPPMVEDGPLRLRYVYEPMRHIGGDFLYARFSPSPHGDAPALNLLVFDVTGHGIAAALTVNRLHGELERLYAEQPGAGPGDILGALNRYVHLTLAGHSVYVTAICCRIDPNREALEYASGGHPPAFVRTVDGRLEQLDSTALVLGAAAAGDFETDVHTHRFGPGDTLVAFTDGALEARNGLGRHLGIVGVQRLLASLKSPRELDCIRAILQTVSRHRAGPPEDDVLVVEVHRALAAGSRDAMALAHAAPV